MRAHPEWGGRNGFSCAGCEQEVCTFGGIVSPVALTGLGGLAVCKPCAARMERQPQFHARVAAKAGGLSARALVQRIADALGLDAQVVHVAIANANAHEQMEIQMDQALGLKPGQFDAALAFAVKSATA